MSMKNAFAVGQLRREARDAGFQYACPACGELHCLQIAVRCMAKLHQDADEQNFETETFGDHEFERNDFMRCGACEYDGEVRDFELRPYKEEEQR